MRFPFNIGLKLHSINTDLIPAVVSLLDKDYFQYIELYIIPGSYPGTHEKWQSCRVPFVIHAPHSFHNMNLAVRSLQEGNIHRFEEAQNFANKLNADGIIVHGGHRGSIKETILQAKLLDDPRILLENMPKVGINEEACVGWSPEDFELAFASDVFKGFVLDFGHANCAALSIQRETMNLILDFLTFNPEVFHLSDGDAFSEKDTHFNLGKGNLPLEKFVEVIPRNGRVTLEVPRSPLSGLKDFAKDVCFLERLMETERSRERKMSLRQAMIDDAEILERWRNEPATRSASLNSEIVLWEEHIRWFEDSLKSPDQMHLHRGNRKHPSWNRTKGSV